MRGPVVAVLALAAVALAGAPAHAQRGRGWLPDLGAGKRLARATGQPLMVVLRCEP